MKHDLLDALKIGLFHTERAAKQSMTLQRMALDKGMHGTASVHAMQQQDAEAGAQVLRAHIEKLRNQRRI